MGEAFLDADEIRAATLVRHVEIHHQLGSTNDRAIELASSLEIELPALVVARRQTAGRGRGSNAWWAAEGSLTFSVAIDPATFGIRTANWPQLSLATAVAVCDAIAAELGSGPPCRISIKWPNDVILADRKVSGILIESRGGGSPAATRLTIGVGVNVNNSWSNAPSELSGRGIALCDVTTQHHSLQQVLIGFLHALERRMSELAAGDEKLPRAWQGLCWLRSRKITMQSDEQSIAGLCRGIAEDGALIVTDGEADQRIYSGTVSIAGE